MKNHKISALIAGLLVFLMTAAAFAQKSEGLTKPAENPPADLVIPGCTAQPIAFGQTVNGTIVSGDCTGTRSSSHRADELTFQGAAGQQIVITMISDSSNNPGVDTVDSYVILRRSDGTVVSFSDDDQTNGSTGGAVNSRIPAITGFLTLPANDTYSIEATTFAGSDFGAYSLTLVDGGIPPCTTTFINYSLPAGTQNGQLATNDCLSRGQFYTDKYAFEGQAGQNVTIDLTSSQLDAYLVLRGPNSQTILVENNDGGTGTNARISFTLPATGTYFIDATSALENQIGNYALTLALNVPSGTIPVSIPTQNVTVGGQVTLPVVVGALPTGTGANAVRSFQFTVAYNAAVLRPVPNGSDLGINQTGTLSAPFNCDTNPVSSTPTPNPGSINVGCFGDGTPISGSGTLINLVFDVIGNGGTSTPVVLNPFMFNEGNPTSFVFTGTGGVIVNQFRMIGNVTYYSGTLNGAPKPIANAQLTASGNPVVQTDSNIRGAYNLEGLTGSTYSVLSRKVGDVQAPGPAPLPGQTGGAAITALDAQRINDHTVGNTVLSTNQQRAADVSQNGVVTSFDAAMTLAFSVGNAVPTNSAGLWKFINPQGAYNTARVYSAAEVQSNLTNQNWTGILLGDVTGNWTQPCVPTANTICQPTPLANVAPENSISVSLPSLTSPASTFIEVPIQVSDLTGRGAVSYNFNVSYNPAVLRPVASPLVQADTLSNAFTTAVNASTPGKLLVGAYGLNALSGSGTLLKMRFEVIGASGANSDLRWDTFFFNEGDPASVPNNGTFLVSGKTKFDFDGDGKADTSVFRSGSGNWFSMNSQSGFTATQFGTATDLLAPADYDGDGRTDVAVVRSNFWYIMQSQGGYVAKDFGLAGDIPAAGDWDGDGKSDLAVYRGGEEGNFYYRPSGTAGVNFRIVRFGARGDIPVAADYDGDGKTDAAVYRPSNGTWYFLNSSNGQFRAVRFGLDTDKLVPADYDGDGKTDIAVYRGGTWYMLKSGSGFAAVQFGIASDKPAPADYDGDGKIDLAVYRAGTWHIQQSNLGYKAVQFGSADDKVVNASYIP